MLAAHLTNKAVSLTLQRERKRESQLKRMLHEQQDLAPPRIVGTHCPKSCSVEHTSEKVNT